MPAGEAALDSAARLYQPHDAIGRRVGSGMVLSSAPGDHVDDAPHELITWRS